VQCCTTNGLVHHSPQTHNLIGFDINTPTMYCWDQEAEYLILVRKVLTDLENMVPIGELPGIRTCTMACAPSRCIANLRDCHELRKILAIGEDILRLLQQLNGALKPALGEIPAGSIHPSLRLHFLTSALLLELQARATRTLHCLQ
jgi:hypothetical protein